MTEQLLIQARWISNTYGISMSDAIEIVNNIVLAITSVDGR